MFHPELKTPGPVKGISPDTGGDGSYLSRAHTPTTASIAHQNARCQSVMK
jgi:hypothetical protein